MFARALTLVALSALAVGCTWEGRPDGPAVMHTTSSDTYYNEGDRVSDPLFDGTRDLTVPLNDEAALPSEAPVDLTQPAPTMGTDDNTSEVEEALTPGTEL